MTWDGVERRRSTFFQRWTHTIIGISAVLVASAALGWYTADRTGDLSDRLTPLEQAPCRLDPGSDLCRKSIDGILQTITPEQAHLLQVRAGQYRPPSQ